ncbi:MAG: Fe-S cluster assembly protein SufD [Patiriisocius sp.]|jgi:Fe-S cluster assembly protein SufD
MDSIVENIISKKDQFLANFSALKSDVKVFGNDITKEAQEALKNLEFPTSKTEAWKYTRVNKIIGQQFSVVRNDESFDSKKYHIPGLDATEVVFVNGFYRADLSTTIENDIITVLPLSLLAGKNLDVFHSYFGTIAKHKTEIFTALNTAYCEDGIFIHVKGNIEKPVHVVNITNDSKVAAQSRNLFVAEANTKADIIQSFISDSEDAVFCNQVTEVVVKANAHLSIDKLQMESDAAFHISNEAVTQGRDSFFSINTFSLTGGWIRNNLDIYAKGQGTNTDLYGLYNPKNKEHIDNHTLVDHCEPDGESNELYKGIIYDKGRAVFNGKVIVEPDAQRTNAYQTNANILMSDDANINSKPELEIYADDVKCSHGSTTGQFDEDAMFYLMARGIKKQNAKKLLTEAFLSEVVDHCTIEAVRELVSNKM